jgi:hypothetical protein
MIDKKKAAALFLEKLEAWEAGHAGQTSGYEYERSYDEFVQLLSEKLFQESVRPLKIQPNLHLVVHPGLY